MKLKTFDKGIHPEYHKELTSSKKVEPAELPKRVIMLLQQHLGAPCEALVKKGDAVEEGQKIGDVKAFISAPVHASISGKVKEVERDRVHYLRKIADPLRIQETEPVVQVLDPEGS